MGDRLLDRLLSEYYAKSNTPGANDVAYLAFRVHKRRIVRELFAQALAELAPIEALRILEVGCSDAADLDHVFRWERDRMPHDVSVIAFDGNEEMLELPRARFAQLGIDATFQAHDFGTPLPVPAASIDIAICSEVVEHLERPDDFLADLHRVLRRSGFLILTTDNTPSLLGRIKRLAGRGAPSPAREPEAVGSVAATEFPIYGHINLRPTSGWERAARSAGFTVVAYGPYLSVRRYAASSAFGTAMLFGLGAVVGALPRKVGRFFGDTTALLLRKNA